MRIQLDTSNINWDSVVEILNEVKMAKEETSGKANLKSAELAFELTDLSLFAVLPEELRRKLWKTACFAPRVIELERAEQNMEVFRLPVLPHAQQIKVHSGVRVAGNSHHPLPVVLRVCRESRDEALTVYKLV